MLEGQNGKLDKKRVLVAMSGGVDSSVTAQMLSEQGFECVGCTMRLYEAPDANAARPSGSSKDVQDARAVADGLRIPYEVLDCADEFQDRVVRPFCDSYLAGRTPNPCIECNRFMKFGRLLERATQQGCWYIATGHYVQVERREDGLLYLKKAADASKDQSYVLYFLGQEQLAHVLFPLGGTLKEHTREIAADQGFVNAEKPESMDICFVPDGDYCAVVRKTCGSLGDPGDFVDAQGTVLGRHQGIACYTIGQRKGLGIFGPEPVYVNAIDLETNTITVGPRQDLLRRDCLVGDVRWAAGKPPAPEFRCAAKIRYRQTEQPCTVRVEPNGQVTLVFDEPQSAITPGQIAVMYDGDYVLGGGYIQ